MQLPWLKACRWACVLLTLSALFGASLLPNPFTVSQVQPATMIHALPHTDVNPLAATFFLEREVEAWKKEQTLKMAREAGLGWVKQMFSWEEIEPQPGVYWNDVYRVKTWDKFDEAVRLSEKYGLRIIARLDRVPAWARPAGSERTSPPTNPEYFGDFVYEVAKRYRGRIQYYQIWNEPNLAAEWGNQPANPAAYVRLLRVAYRRIKEADPDAVVLSAPLAQTLESGPLNLSDVEYLRAMYRAGVGGWFDILGANGYGFEFPPDDPPALDRLNFQRFQLLRQIMVQNGDAGKPVWLNEVAWNAAPSSLPPEKVIWRRVTEQQQAEFTARAIELARSWDWVGVVGLWYFRQVGDIPATEAAYYFRIVDVDFTPRPLYRALQKLGASLTVAHPGLHEETSPAVEVQGRWESRRTPSASGGGLLESQTAGGSLSFTFEGTEVDLVTQRGANGGLILVQVDGAPSVAVPRDRQGRAYVDLRDSAANAPEHVALARGLPPGRHTLQLVVASRDSSVAPLSVMVDGFVVRSVPPSFWGFYTLVALVGLGLVGLVSSFWLRRRA